MIRTIASCPFCAEGVVAFDDRLEIIFNPDAGKNLPCKHLSLFWASLSGPQNWSWTRYWECGRGLSQLNTDDVLTELILDLTIDLSAHNDLPRTPCLVVGATAFDREDRKPGTGEFWVYRPDRSPELVCLDGFAIYAYDASAVVAAVHDKVRTIKMEAGRVN